MVEPQKMVWILWRLRASGALNAQNVASLLIHILPVLVQKFAGQARKVDEICQKHFNTVQPILDELRQLASQVPGLEPSGPALEAAAAAKGSAGEALLAVCLALSD